ncbi:hypothetical protein FRC06_009334, partial [Ceratobasidium sp. 370]
MFMFIETIERTCPTSVNVVTHALLSPLLGGNEIANLHAIFGVLELEHLDQTSRLIDAGENATELASVAFTFLAVYHGFHKRTLGPAVVILHVRIVHEIKAGIDRERRCYLADLKYLEFFLSARSDWRKPIQLLGAAPHQMWSIDGHLDVLIDLTVAL